MAFHIDDQFSICDAALDLEWVHNIEVQPLVAELPPDLATGLGDGRELQLPDLTVFAFDGNRLPREYVWRV